MANTLNVLQVVSGESDPLRSYNPKKIKSVIFMSTGLVCVRTMEEW